MGSIISSGIGSGLDIAGLVTQLVAAEGAPTSTRLNRNEASLQAELSAFGSVRSALATLRDALDSLTDLEAFRGRSVTLSGTDYLKASATSSAVTGNYAIEVERLATAHRLASAPFATSATVVGTGTLGLTTSAGTFNVLIDSNNNTVAGIRDAIKAATDNTGVLATIINGVDGSRLILTVTKTGVANSLTVTESGGDGGLSPLIYDPVNMITNMTELDAPLDARILVNGFAVEDDSNSITDAIDGLTIDLLKKNLVGETTDVAVSFDQVGSKAAINQLITAYNAFVDSTSKLSSFDAETKIRGPLFGDSTLSRVTFRLRQELTSTVTGLSGPFDNLVDIGITTDLDGKLVLDTAKLDAAFTQDFDAVGALFADTSGGIATRLDALIDPLLETGGILDARTDGIEVRIDDIGDRREALNRRLAIVEARLFREFNALDGLLAQLQATSNFLTAQLDNLPGFVFTGNRR